MSRLARRKAINRIATAVCLLFAVAAFAPLLAVLSEVVSRGWNHVSWEFLTQTPYQETSGEFRLMPGIQHAILGTGILVGLGAAIGAPIGILAGIHLAEARPTMFTNAVRLAADSLAGIPSIVAGLFAYALLVTQYGYNAWAGAVALAVLMVPTVTRTTEEALRTVPQSYREAALALGAPRWYTIVRVVFPAAWGAVTTGLLLGVARIAGETAPLLLTVGSSGTFLQTDPSKPVAALPMLIYDYFKTGEPRLVDQAWGAALVLIGMILVVNLAVRFVSLRSRPH